MRWFFFTFAACLLICVMRNAVAVTAPLLVWDDVLIFNDFFAGRGSLFHIYPDNISLAPNIIFLVSFAFFSLPLLPAGLQTMAVVFYAAMTAVPSLPAFAAVIPDPRKRVLLAVWIAAMPLSDLSLILSPDYQNWSSMIPVFLFTGLLAAAAAAAERPRVSPLWSALLVPCALANPLSVATAPFNAVAAAVSWRRGMAATAVNAALLAAAGLAAALLAAVTAPQMGGGSGIGAPQVLDAAWRAGLFLLDRGFLEALLGSPARQAVLDALPAAGAGLAPTTLYAAAAAAAALVIGLAAGNRQRPVVAFAATLVGAAFVYSFVVLVTLGPMRGLAASDTGILTTFGRYWFVQKVAVLTAVGALLLEASPLSPRLSPYAAALALGAFLIAYAADADTGSRYGLSGKADPRRADRERRSATQRAFLEAVQAAQRRHAAGCLLEPGDSAAPLLRLTLPEGIRPPADAAETACSVP
ncbi:hypothetical protein D3273_20940 [Lichenibacterium minor]|uniref:DUF2079 domain-containing protein n=1 Tax=Lichenibacterium minor TaxID=2316528 RepID=A0A4Q2U0Q4_9HYPH|nr:hypothetical protein [Lichenibacterium minor]RYC30003.1 hypothetical protein D3273_20940 [Lichenibacterium minor]